MACAMVFELILLDLENSSGCVQAGDEMVLDKGRSPGNNKYPWRVSIISCSGAEVQTEETVWCTPFCGERLWSSCPLLALEVPGEMQRPDKMCVGCLFGGCRAFLSLPGISSGKGRMPFACECLPFCFSC